MAGGGARRGRGQAGWGGVRASGLGALWLRAPTPPSPFTSPHLDSSLRELG